MSKHPTTRRFHVKIPVRFRDLDPMGHVNNSVYFTYLEVARTAYWQELHHDYSYDVLDFVVARAECDYVSAAMLREVVRVEVWLSRSEEHTSELQSQSNLVCRLLLEK